MPRYPAAVVSGGWQVVQRADGWWLQRQTRAGTWRDFSGPYQQRNGAVTRWQRETQSTKETHHGE